MTPEDSCLFTAFIADLHPGLGASIARRYEGGYDAAAGRARFSAWLSAHTDHEEPLADYLARAGRAPQLTAEQEASLAARAQAGERAAAQLADGDAALAGPARAMLEHTVQDGAQAGEQLLEASLRLVVTLAKRFAGRGLAFADLVQAGHRGLNRALQKYDPARGYRFAAFATWWIRQAITRAIADQPAASLDREAGALGPVPRAADRLTEAEGQLLRALGRAPTPEELATELDPSALA